MFYYITISIDHNNETEHVVYNAETRSLRRRVMRGEGLSPQTITKVVRHSNSKGTMTRNDKFMRTSAGISSST